MKMNNSKRMESLNQLMGDMKKDSQHSKSSKRSSKKLDCSTHSTRSSRTSSKSIASVTSERSSKSNRSGRSSKLARSQGMSAQHVIVIQKTWDKIRSKEGFQTTIGEALLLHMNKATQSNSETFATELGNRVVDELDSIIHDLGPSLCPDDLLARGMEWIDMGIDLRVLHKAVVGFLEEALNKSDYTSGVECAWNTSFLDVLMKMSPSN